MPTVNLSDETFLKLKGLAEPFVDTPDSVIDRLATEELKRRAAGGLPATPKDEDVVLLDPDHPESLTHTKLLAASIDGEPMYRAKWNGVLDRLHVIGRQRLGSFEALAKISGAHIKPTKETEAGFHYLDEAGLSIQGVDANLAWYHSLNLARHLGVPIELKFEWREKEGAARPGETGILRWKPMN